MLFNCYKFLIKIIICIIIQICKDKVEAEVWIAGLKALISSGRGGRSKIDGWSDGGLYLDVIYIHRNLYLIDFYTLYGVVL